MKNNGVPLVTIPDHDVNHQDFLNKFKQYRPQVLITLFSQKAELPLRTLAPFGCLNIHFSYLPENAGREPVFWSLLKERGYGLTIYQMGEEFDSGKILAQKKLSSTGLNSLHEAIKNVCVHIPETLEIALRNLEMKTDSTVVSSNTMNGWPEAEDVKAFYNGGFKFI